MRSSVLSAIVVGVVIGFAGVLAFMRPHRAAAGERPARRIVTPAAPPAVASLDPPLPPDSARSSELFERNRSMPSDPDLAAEYEAMNDRYFSNILPPPNVRWESGLEDLGPMIAERFSVHGLTDGRMILLNPAIEHDADERRRALAHEMVHMAVWLQDKEHGPVFQERLRELSLRGAFKGIVATEQEKDAALATLQEQHAVIDAEERALLAARESLDRASRAAVDAFNARVRRQQSAIAEYNSRVAQYNLMISYPDGLARERLKARGDGTLPER